MTEDSRYGIRIMICELRLKNLFLMVSMAMAQKIANALPNTIKTRLYRIVFRVMIKASPVLNRYLKLSNPAHGLFQIPT